MNTFEVTPSELRNLLRLIRKMFSNKGFHKALKD
jgi:hypothetical protein